MNRTAAVAAAMILAFALRAAWPLDDPADGLTWSNSPFTDPAAIVHGARDAHVLGSWSASGARGQVFFPLWNALVWGVWRIAGPSRLSLQLLIALVGTAGVGFGAWAARRTGLPAAPAALVLGATAWLVMFGRVPLTEHLGTAVLALSAVSALRRGTVDAFIAGSLVGIAAFFVKANAVLFVPALLGFLTVRERSVRPALAVLGGFAASGVVWAVVILPWGADEIATQLDRARALYGGRYRVVEMVLSPWYAIRSAWLIHRIPVLAVLGGLFVLGTLLQPELRERRHRDGTALFAWWVAALWIGTAVVQYQPPRYFVPIAFGLALCGLAALVELARGGRIVPWPARRPAEMVFWFLALLTVTVAAIEAGSQWGVIAVGRLVLPGDPGYDLMIELWEGWKAVFEPFSTVLLASLIVAVVGTVAVRLVAGRSADASGASSTSRLVVPLALAIAIFQLAQLAAAAQLRSRSLEEAKESLETLLGDDAVLLGTLAPTFVQDSRRVAVSRFGALEVEDLQRHGATHVILMIPWGLREAERTGILDHLAPLRSWPVSNRHVRGILLYRIRGTAADVAPSPFERAVAALETGDPAGAEAELAAMPDANRSPDVWSLRARIAHIAGDPREAIRCLEMALELRPGNTANWYNLGVLRRNAGDPEGARDAWRRGMRLDPWDNDLREELRQLAASLAGSGGI